MLDITCSASTADDKADFVTFKMASNSLMNVYHHKIRRTTIIIFTICTVHIYEMYLT